MLVILVIARTIAYVILVMIIVSVMLVLIMVLTMHMACGGITCNDCSVDWDGCVHFDQKNGCNVRRDSCKDCSFDFSSCFTL